MPQEKKRKTRKKVKVCIVSKNTVTNDLRTLKEATILSESDLEVVIIGLLGKEQNQYEQYNGFIIRRVPTTLGLALIFRDRVYLPLYRRLTPKGREIAKRAYRIIAQWLRWVDRRLKPITIYWRLIRAMLSEKANYYHAHFPVFLMTVVSLAASLSRRRFIRDYNDILVLENSHRVEKGYYEQDVLWSTSLSDREIERIKATIRLIPFDVRSILDVGCGDGRITNQIADLYPNKLVVGIDISQRALQYVQAKAIRGSAECLPFKDRCFDLLLATELLEHLPNPIYEKTLKEIQRVAKRWILIGVPYKEQLAVAQARCIRCKITFHVNHHYRTFDKFTLRNLFIPEFKCVSLKETGGQRAYYFTPLLWSKRYLGGIWTRTTSTLCPRCKTHLYPDGFPERNAISYFCDKWNEKIKHRKKLEKSHIIALYQRVA